MTRANASLTAVAATGDRRKTLERLRQELATEIDAKPGARDLAALSRQMQQVLAELDGLSGSKKESKVDDLAARRAARRADAKGKQRASGGDVSSGGSD